MSGYFRMEAATWESILELLPRPLSTEHAAMDLRHIADQVRLHEGGRLPEHCELAKRWGWYAPSGATSDKRVRLLKANEDAWKDPYRRKGQAEDRPGTGQGQGKDRQRTCAKRSKANSPPVEDRTRTGGGQAEDRPGTGEGPHARSRPPTPVTDTDTDKTVVDLPVDDPPVESATIDPPPAGVTARRLVAEQAGPVFTAYRRHHPQKPPHPTAKEKKAIEDRIREVIGTRGQRTTDLEAVASAGLALIAIVEWAHEAPDAEFYREKKALGLESPLLKADKFADRLDRALAWEAAGKPRHARTSRRPHDVPAHPDDVPPVWSVRRKGDRWALLDAGVPVQLLDDLDLAEAPRTLADLGLDPPERDRLLAALRTPALETA